MEPKRKTLSNPNADLKPISLRYTCAPNGTQVGLSHYLMAIPPKVK